MPRIVSLFLIALCIQPFSARAQHSFFIQPYIAGGITDGSYNMNDFHTSGNWAFTFNGGVNAGYESGRWAFTAGLQYLRTGINNVITYMDILGNPIGHANDYTFFHQLALPLTAGYRIKLSRKLSLQPTIGAGIAYSTSASETDMVTGKLEKMPSGIFDNDYNKVNVFGTVAAQLEDNIFPRLSVTCAPMFLYNFTNMFSSGNNSPGVTTGMHEYELVLSAGIKWNLVNNKGGKVPKPVN